MLDFKQVKSVTIPNGEAKEIKVANQVLWKKKAETLGTWLMNETIHYPPSTNKKIPFSFSTLYYEKRIYTGIMHVYDSKILKAYYDPGKVDIIYDYSTKTWSFYKFRTWTIYNMDKLNEQDKTALIQWLNTNGVKQS